MITKWPEEIEIPDKIGAVNYTYRNGNPCCAIGHFRQITTNAVCRAALRESFEICARHLKPCRNVMAEFINDRNLSPKERVLVYAAALAYVGYTLHNFPEAEELARKAKGAK